MVSINVVRKEGRKGRTAVELGIGKEPNKVRAILGLHVVALQMERNIAKRDRIAINVKRPHRRRRVFAFFSGLRELAEEILRKVGWR